ncbi:Glutamyl aminopeptidase, M42 family [Alteracholeplasma palmae J233]|uniref:Glutamyl aminopeptidase, M42 family n=1 Tax=Alteracholeplasma palmae (strain ATCC 49389 / J233) TaxID=1318466 RepID=U4KKH8_ALTPJ|nr:M42 family peptidase [Alteracholeplasma palmae]CCV64083.1 Glutamyl aminopeptidase, M42 family [Alteracholeplasma palmae J233]
MNKIYEELMNLPGISGHEQRVRKYIKDYMQKYSKAYEIVQDNLGSIFAVKKSKNKNAKTVMVAGHMDEVGLIVAKILDNGLIVLHNIGGLTGEVFVSQVMHVYTKNDEVIKGIIGSIPPHLKKEQSNAIADLRLDIGATSKEEVLSWGVSLGDMVLFANQFSYTHDKKRVISKAIDNRYGCGLALEVIAEFSDKELPFNLVVGTTVQEEVGLRGAETSVNLFNPEIFIALDASPVNDLLDPVNSLAKLGAGFLLRMYDPRNIMHKGLMSYFISLANDHDIKFQYFTSMGGTDAAKALDMNEGVLATTIGLPSRYIHSTAAMMDISDLDEARKMIFQVLKDLDDKKIKKLLEANR